MPSSDDFDPKEFEAFKKRAYSYTDKSGNQVTGVKDTIPELTISRLRRCQNCLHFDTDEKAQRYFTHCIERDKKNLRAHGCSEEGIQQHVRKLESGIRDMFGAVGFCTIRDKRTDEGADGDFTPFHYQCDKWEGRIIISSQEAAADPSHQEVLANLKKVDR